MEIEKPRVAYEISDIILNKVREVGSPFLVEMCRHHFQDPGKLLRPRIVYGLAGALGLDKSQFLGWAAAVETLHNATLVHDDLQDGDELRRGTPTIWKKFGAAQAINCGDFLMLLAPSFFLDSDLGAETKSELSRLYSIVATEVVKGQTSEPTLREYLGQSDLAERYRTCISQKTSALFAGAAEGVGLIAGFSKPIRSELAVTFRGIGDLFQIQDDVLDLYGDKGRKAVGCDVKEGKVSALVVSHLAFFPEDLPRIQGVLLKGREETSNEDIYGLIELFRAKGTLQRELTQMLLKKEELTFGAHPQIGPFVVSLLEGIFDPIRHLLGEKAGPL